MPSEPDNYDERLTTALDASFEKLQFRIFERPDLVLATRSRAGARHLMKHPAVSDVANDPRLLAIASGFLGTSALPYRATLFDKSSARNWLVTWHQDVAVTFRGGVLGR
jgi:hypothetical protein